MIWIYTDHVSYIEAKGIGRVNLHARNMGSPLVYCDREVALLGFSWGGNSVCMDGVGRWVIGAKCPYQRPRNEENIHALVNQAFPI